MIYATHSDALEEHLRRRSVMRETSAHFCWRPLAGIPSTWSRRRLLKDGARAKFRKALLEAQTDQRPQVKDEVTDALKRAEQAGIVRVAGWHGVWGISWNERKDKKKLTFIYCASFYVYSSIRNSITNSRHKSIIHHLLKTFIQIDIQDLSPSRKTLMICLSFFPFLFSLFSCLM